MKVSTGRISVTPCDFANIDGNKVSRIMKASGNEFHQHAAGTISDASHLTDNHPEELPSYISHTPSYQRLPFPAAPPTVCHVL